MSKGLEALKVIYDLEDLQGGRDVFWESYRIIEKELQRLMVYDIQQEQNEKWLENAKKKLKAFEIMKNKRVNVRAIIGILENKCTWEQYMDEEDDTNTSGHQFSRDRLTREEYDLLKEVIENYE